MDSSVSDKTIKSKRKTIMIGCKELTGLTIYKLVRAINF